MALLQGVLSDKRRLLAATLLIFVLAAALRLSNIGWSFSDNGVDEGIMLMRARMLSEGFDLYSEIPCDQAPLALLVAAALEGDVLASRLLCGLLSIAAIAACMEAAKRSRGEAAMLVTGLILAVDFAFLRESRLFSLDGMSAFFLAFSLVPLLAYAKGGSRLMLLMAGALLGLSAAAKLYGAMAVAGFLVFILVESFLARKGGRPASGRMVDAVVFVAASVAPLAVLMALLGPSEMLDGMVFDQGHRELDLAMKLSIPLYFAFNVAYVLLFVRARSLWARSVEARALICVSLVLLLNFIVQPLAFLHNLVLMSPPLAVLVGMAVADTLEHKRINRVQETRQAKSRMGISAGSAILALVVASAVVSAGVASYGIAAQGKSPQQVYGERIASWTSEDDWIISGDPLVAAYAGRNVPLSMINMGTRIYPDIALEDVQKAVVEHAVPVVVVCYRLFEEDMASLPAFLEAFGFVLVAQQALGEWAKPAIDTGSNERVPLVYVSEEVAAAFGLPTA